MGENKEATMSKHSSSALGLTVAIALTTGGVLVEHPANPNEAPGAYSDITIAADNQNVPPVDKAGNPTPPQAATPTSPSTAEVPPAVQTTPGEESKGTPERKP